MTASGAAARAVAHSNIALVKYWGKLDRGRNLPAVPSLSLTLDALYTTTRVELCPGLERDEATLDGAPLTGPALNRIVEHLDRLRAIAGETARARVESVNTVPTAAGLASSASGFAALTVAGSRAFGLDLDPAAHSALARQGSASAARSIFGGWAALRVGAESAEPVAGTLDVRLLVVVTSAGPKAIGSTQAMLHTAATSPYYSAWTASSPAIFDRAVAALNAGDFSALGSAMEQSTLMMHASMFAADPAVVYFKPATLAVIERVKELRAGGNEAYFTMDAGPHVKVLTPRADATSAARALREVAGVNGVIECTAGPAAREISDEGRLE